MMSMQCKDIKTIDVLVSIRDLAGPKDEWVMMWDLAKKLNLPGRKG